MGRLLFIFDLDGTLLDTVEDLAAAVNLARGHFGLAPLPVQTVSGYVGDGVRTLMARALEGSEADLDEAVALQRTYYLQHLCDRTRPYPGVPEGLRSLREAGHVLAVATNKAAEATRVLLARFGLASCFHDVLGGGSVPNLKPHPQMLEVIMRSAGIPPTLTWMVGDHRTDLESARRAGVRSVYLSYGIGNTGAEQPTLKAASFPEFVDLFLSGC